MQLVTFNENNISFKKNKIKKNSDIYFVGDWCIDSRNYFSNSKTLDVYKYCYSSNKKTNDVKYLKKIYEIILVNLTTSLNQYHKTNYNKKYWEILLFRWLWLYLVQLYSIWEIARLVTKKNLVKLIYYLDFDKNIFIPENTIHHRNILLSQNNYWTHLVFTEIFKFHYEIKLKKINSISNIKNIINDLNPGIFKASVFNYKVEDFFLYDFNIPKKEKLKIILKKIKHFFFAKIIFKKKINLNNNYCRKKFYFYKKKKDNFLNFANNFLKFNLPKIYLENYQNLENEYKKINWPKKPKYILTSHAHYFDEIFKIYTAKKIINSKTKLGILQHGSGGFFINDNFYNIYIEKKISDKYFAWGSHQKNKKIISFPINTVFKNTNSVKFEFKKKNKILLELYDFNEIPIRPPVGYISSKCRKIITIDLFKNFFENLVDSNKSQVNLKFLNTSGKNIIQNTIIKKYPSINILNTKNFSYEIRKKFNLQVHFYIGTGFFESMYLNSPVILIYDEKLHDGLNKKFLKIINLLINSNICFQNSNDASNFINLNYLSIDKWWNSKNVQKVRKLFIRKYCGAHINLSNKLIRILK